jgi:hypothetical protein
MKSKKLNKQCTDCMYYNGNCNHKSNTGILIKYRKETKFYIKTPEELNADGKCESYAKAKL